MSEINVAQLRELAERATPGPWTVLADAEHESLMCAGPGTVRIHVDHRFDLTSAKADAEFIAAARTALPELLRELETQRQRIDELTPCQSPDHLLCDNENTHPRSCHCLDPLYWKQQYEKAMRALESLTPSGSEYVGDVERCVEWIRRRFTVSHEMLIKAKLSQQKAEATVETQGKRIEELIDERDALSLMQQVGAQAAVQVFRRRAEAAESALSAERDRVIQLEEALRRILNQSRQGGRCVVCGCIQHEDNCPVPRGELALTKPSAPLSDGWIPVGEKLPEEWDVVLTHNGHGRVRENFISAGGGWKRWADAVTHWRPLPSAPVSTQVKEEL